MPDDGEKLLRLYQSLETFVIERRNFPVVIAFEPLPAIFTAAGGKADISGVLHIGHILRLWDRGTAIHDGGGCGVTCEILLRCVVFPHDYTNSINLIPYLCNSSETLAQRPCNCPK